MTMSYTLPERNELLDAIPDLYYKIHNKMYDGALFVMSTKDLDALHVQLTSELLEE